MEDLQIVKLADVVTVNRVRILSGAELRLEGANMDGTSVVRVNHRDVPFSVLSNVVIDVHLPEELQQVPIQTIDVLSDSFSGTDRSRVIPSVSGPARSVTGLLKLIQQYVAVLFTTPGSNIFRKEEGGGLLQLLGANVDPTAPSSYTSIVQTGVDKTNRDIIRSQLTRRLPDDERLRSARLQDVSFSKTTGRINFVVAFETFSGTKALAAVSSS